MIEWETMAYLATCSAGTLLFLRLVANDLELASLELDTLEEQEKGKAQRQQAETTNVVETAQALTERSIPVVKPLG